MDQKRNPAVLAGLAGALLWATPAVAQAASLTETLDAAFVSPSYGFAAGLAAGAGIAACAMGAASLVAARRSGNDAEAEADTGAVADTVDKLQIEPHLEAEAEPEPQSASIVEPAIEPELDSKAEKPRRAGSHFKVAPVENEQAVTEHRQAREVEQTPAPDAKSVPAVSAAEPKAKDSADHAATDYEQIALNYANKEVVRARKAVRSQGVAATLLARMGAGKMDGVPVIERADGTVGDVGTGWWTAAVGEENIKRVSDLAQDGDLGETVLSVPADYSIEVEAPAPRNMQVPGFLQQAGAASSAHGSRERSAGSIADRVAFVDEGVFPERRSMDDLAVKDEWEQALRSLDEKIVADPSVALEPSFVDTVGGIDTLDEPDNIEPNTQFIPFRTPAGHPEVVDTASYVDYLIATEFDKNESRAARASSHRFLTLIEGGSQPTARVSRRSEKTGKQPYVPKHFALPKAAEA